MRDSEGWWPLAMCGFVLARMGGMLDLWQAQPSSSTRSQS